jgi:hypothetical protein
MEYAEMANTKTITLEAAVKAAADMAIAAKPGYGQTRWVEARASLQVLISKVAREWAALQGRTVGRAEMHTQVLDLVRQELVARRDALRDYRAAAEATRLAAAFAAPARPARRKATTQTAALAAPTRKATKQAVTKQTVALAKPARSARPAMSLEALVAAGFARQAAKAAEKAGAAPAEIKVVRKAAKAVAKAAAKAAKAAKKEAQAAFKESRTAKASAKTKGRKV